MTSKQIQSKLIQYLRRRTFSLILPNTYIKGGKYESDVIQVAKTGFWVEYEIKISVSDYKADFRKSRNTFPNRKLVKRSKHDDLSSKTENIIKGSRSGPLPKPKKFFFVTPAGLLDDIELPNHVGLLEFTPESKVWDNPVVKKAPNLKKPTKLDYNQIWNLAAKAGSRLYFQDYS